jgi:hypothetical protein
MYGSINSILRAMEQIHCSYKAKTIQRIIGIKRTTALNETMERVHSNLIVEFSAQMNSNVAFAIFAIFDFQVFGIALN